MTRAGLLVANGDRLALHRWPALDESWSIPLATGPEPESTPLVATTATGIAVVDRGPASVVGRDSSLRLDWYG